MDYCLSTSFRNKLVKLSEKTSDLNKHWDLTTPHTVPHHTTLHHSLYHTSWEREKVEFLLPVCSCWRPQSLPGWQTRWSECNPSVGQLGCSHSRFVSILIIGCHNVTCHPPLSSLLLSPLLSTKTNQYWRSKFYHASIYFSYFLISYPRPEDYKYLMGSSKFDAILWSHLTQIEIVTSQLMMVEYDVKVILPNFQVWRKIEHGHFNL